MPTLFALFAIIAVPILFFMLTWVVVTACRIFFPEKPQVIERDGVLLRQQASDEGISIPVGAREIKEDQRHLFRSIAEANYHYERGDSEGLPVSWFEELHNRRN
jgi:hypothetical protein